MPSDMLSDKDFAETLNTIDQLRDVVVEHMIAWFHHNYEDPVESQPVESGEFVWLVPKCDAREELEDNFPNVGEDLIIRAVEEIEEDGTTEWVSNKDLEDFSK